VQAPGQPVWMSIVIWVVAGDTYAAWRAPALLLAFGTSILIVTGTF